MTDIGKAIKHLKENGVEAFEDNGILVIPCSSPEEIYDLAGKARRLFKEIDYQKSWQINPYYYEKKTFFDEEPSQELHVF